MTQLFSNNAGSALTVAMNDSDTTLVMSSGDQNLFPTITVGGDFFFLTLEDETNLEIVKVTATTANTFTVVRAQEGTLAENWLIGTKFSLRLTKGTLEDFQSSILTASNNSTNALNTANSAIALATSVEDTVAALHAADIQFVPAGSLSSTDVQAVIEELDAKVWTNTNDGSGSGLDADKLDGYHAKAFFTCVNTVASIRSLDSTLVQACGTFGYWAVGDGGSGFYYVDTADTTSAENGGTIIVGNDGARWKLRFHEGYHIKQWGAKCDGTTDDLTYWQAALDNLPNRATLYVSGVSVIGGRIVLNNNQFNIKGPCRILAKAATNFEYMMQATSKTGIVVEEIEFDANQANRVSGQNVRFVGGVFTTCTDCKFVKCKATNTLGYSNSSAIGLVAASGGLRCQLIGCIVYNCGGILGTDASDGIFTSGEQNEIIGCIAINCTDTGFVIESSQKSVISGCTADNCSAGAAITNANASDKSGNIINGLTIRNWDASNTGGIQIGCPTTDNGNLLNTIVSNVVMYAEVASYGHGAAINIRQDVSRAHGKAIGVQLSNITINGARNQGILVDGNDVDINNVKITNTTETCIQFQDGSDGIVTACKLYGGTYGVATNGNADVEVKISTCKSNGYGLYAFDTSTITSVMNTIKSSSTARTGKDSGATINYVGMEVNALALNNSTGSAPGGSLTNGIPYYDRNGNLVGHIGVYA